MKERDSYHLAVGVIAALGMVFGLHACGGESFSSKSDNNGVGGSATGGAHTGGSSGTGGAMAGGTGTGGSTGTPCGDATCGEGEYCCNESCNLCAPFGIGCSTDLCSGGGSDGGVIGVECGPTTCGADEICCDAQCGYCGPAGEPCAAGTCVVGEQCGSVTCASDQVCCDATCGYCGVDCPADPCGAMNAVRCGRGYCQGGQACCDFGCGTCGTNGACPVQVCLTPDCTKMEASGDANASCGILGYRWNEMACEEVVGCDCTGAHCDMLFATLDECQAAHVYCVSVLPL